MWDVVVVGGGAAGFFAAIHIAEAGPKLKIAIVERGKDILGKVKVSGGGRCNVTHAEFNPKELANNYPRGSKELVGPFHSFAPGDTIDFFQKRGVDLKIEEDGRMFPTTDSSQTIIDCFTSEVKRLGIEILTLCSVNEIKRVSIQNGDYWQIASSKRTFESRKLVLATGSNPKIWNMLADLGHAVVSPVPSLFTFNIKDERIHNIPGVSTNVEVSVLDKKKALRNHSQGKSNRDILFAEGPLLITHWGMSGPAILKLSAWGARILETYNYQFKIRINWVPDYHPDGLLELFMKVKEVEKKTVIRTKVVDIPKRLWVNLVRAAHIDDKLTWSEINKKQLLDLVSQLTGSLFQVNGKSTFKEEFVTAGGVDLKEVNFKTFESRILPDLYFAGEILNIDAITGGFNFQNAWTGGYLAAQGIVQSFDNA